MWSTGTYIKSKTFKKERKIIAQCHCAIHTQAHTRATHVNMHTKINKTSPYAVPHRYNLLFITIGKFKYMNYILWFTSSQKQNKQLYWQYTINGLGKLSHERLSKLSRKSVNKIVVITSLYLYTQHKHTALMQHFMLFSIKMNETFTDAYHISNKH